MKSYLALICTALLVGVFCAVFAAPGGNLTEPQPEPALSFPEYSIDPPRILNESPELEDASVSISESSSGSSSESSSEETDGAKPEGRTLFLILRLLQLLSQSNSTSSG